MTSVKEIENAIQLLPKQEVMRLITWFKSFDQKLWDAEIKEDASSGKLNFLIQEAKDAVKTDKLHNWPRKKK